MNRQGSIDVGAFLEDAQIGWFHLIVLLSTCMIMFVEGYDMQVTSYAAPAIIKIWHLKTSYFGPVFGFALFGNMLGGLGGSHLGDHYGRKRLIIAGSFFFGLFTLLSAYATTVTALVFLRFIAGLGIGASIPAAIALAVEYAPAKRKATVISLLFLGYTIGGTAGGFIAAKLIPRFGWQSVFQLGGVAPIIIALIITFTMPESIRYLAHRGERFDQVRVTLQKIRPDLLLDRHCNFTVHEVTNRGFPVKHLFTNGRATITILLWISFVTSLLGHYFLTSWLPTILAGASVPLTYAIVSGALLQGGGGIGGLVLCWLSDRKSILFIAAAFCIASPLIFIIPDAHGLSLLLLAVLVGFFLVGGQIGLNSIAGTIYPTDIRTTGIGWALGVGRIGSIMGPILGGILISHHLRNQVVFLYAGLVVLTCSATVVILWKVRLSFATPELKA